MDKGKIYDVAVIGAGIHGAGVAQAASLNGWSVALVEQYEEAALGTSSKSSKLIHGGLRYLETGQYALVRECLKERSLLLKLAPDLIELKTFVIPLTNHLKRNPFVIFLGLLLYWMLSGFSRSAFPRFFSAKKLESELPQFAGANIKGALVYSDAQTDDALLTRAVVRSAEDHGCETFYKHRIKSITKVGDFFRLEFANNGEQIMCRSLVNASGPWVNHVAERISPTVPKADIDLVQGSHIILSRPAPNHCIYCESPRDGRALFILPWKGLSLVGTTERDFSGNPDKCEASQEEIEYLLEAYNAYHAGCPAKLDDIKESFCGLRVLPNTEGPNTTKSRETILITRSASPSYIAIYGGKLTAYRLTANKVVLHLSSFLTRKVSRSSENVQLNKA